jgi:PGF-pre-PGF domain-containing protein
MDKRFLVFIALLILLSSSGIGITAAESSGGNSTNTNSVSSKLTDDTSINDTSVGTSVNNTYVDDTSVNDTSVNDTSVGTSVNNTYVDDTSSDNNSVNSVSTENNLTYENESVSSESQTNIQHVETTQVNINNSQNVNISITNYNSVVNNINFDTKKALGKTTVVVEDLKDKSTLVNNPPSGNIYKSFNIYINNRNVNYIENTVVGFQVEQSWLKENNFDKSAIVLNRYISGKWVAVPVTITGQDTKYVYFTAKVSGYSSFAITGTTNQTIVTTEQNVNNNSAGSVNLSNQNEIIRLLNEIISRLDKILELLK